MSTKNSKTRLLVWVGVIILTVLFFVLQQCKVLDWSVWQTFIPLIVAVIVMVVCPLLILDIIMARRKRALRNLCKQMIQIIKATDESNMAENIQLCLKIAEQIEGQREDIKKIPATGGDFKKSVMGPVSLLINNNNFMEKLTKFTEEDLEEDPVELLKSYEQVYSELWF